MKTTPENNIVNVEALATAFSKKVNEELAEHLEEINKRNDKGDDTACATHDFSDSNMIMADAWVEVFGSEPTSPADEEEKGILSYNELDRILQTEVDIWNAAWGLAKGRRFSIQ